MCIRDSVNGEWKRGHRCRLALDLGATGVGNGGAIALIAACLLYTSDAADERSSVDLGGRRIIKKKKYDKVSGAREIEHINREDQEHNK